MTTLSKEQAASLSAALLAGNVPQGKGFLHRFFSYVHPLYRFPELSALEPLQQAALVRSASRLADKQLHVLLIWFLFIAAILGTAFLALSSHQGSLTLLAVFVFLGIPAVLVRRTQVHRHVLSLLDKKSRDR